MSEKREHFKEVVDALARALEVHPRRIRNRLEVGLEIRSVGDFISFLRGATLQADLIKKGGIRR